MQPKEILFRPEDDTSAEWLRQNADAHNRSVSAEVRAAISIYRDLVELAHVRASVPTKGQERRMEDLARRLETTIGQVLLAAITDAARNKFENDAGVVYPKNQFGEIVIPFDRLLEWVATGKVNGS